MKLFKLSNKFAKDESGAVTVDWVVLTAALVGIAIALVGVIDDGIDQTATDIQDEILTAISAHQN